MIARCYRQSSGNYSRYGGAGIQVCARWALFSNFLADMGERPLGTTLDRLDNDKGYEPGNCRWATPAQQAQNRRSTKMSRALIAVARALRENGRTQREIGVQLGVSQSVISMVLRGRTWA